MDEEDDINMAGLDQEVGFALRLAQVAVFRDLIVELKPLALRPADYSLLLIVHANPGMKQQSLGTALSVQGPNLVTMVDQMESRGLIVRSAAPADRRAHALHITPKGRNLLKQAKAAHARHHARVTKCLGGNGASEFVETLHRMARL